MAAATQILEVPIAGMDCDDCAHHVHEAIAAVPGVESVDVLLTSEKAVIHADPLNIDLAAIRHAVEGAGYSVPERSKDDPQRAIHVRAGVRVEVASIIWMIIEGTVAIAAGIIARSVLLTAFGVDSVIELITGAVLLWRLLTEARNAAVDRVARAENRAAWVTGIGLVLLCAYVVVSAALDLIVRNKLDSSNVGLILSVIAVGIMPYFAWRKRRIAREIGSSALRGDAACSVPCAYMAGALLVGLALNRLFGWWWADPLAAVVLLYWLVPEAREALEGAKAGRGGCSCGDED